MSCACSLAFESSATVHRRPSWHPALRQQPPLCASCECVQDIELARTSQRVRQLFHNPPAASRYPPESGPGQEQTSGPWLDGMISARPAGLFRANCCRKCVIPRTVKSCQNGPCEAAVRKQAVAASCPAAESWSLPEGMRTMLFHANYVATSVAGDYYQAMFAEEDTDDPDRAYLIIQRQFEDPEKDDTCYIETHDRKYSGQYIE